MKKRILKTLMAVVMMFLPLVAPAVNTIIHTAYYNSATIGTDTLGGVTYATVHYEGLYNGGAPGTPSLPVDYIRFSVPYNATNFTVTAQPKNTYSSRLDYPIYPCQEPRMMSDTTPVVITLPDSAAYYSGSDYPTQRAWVVDEGFLAGENHIVTVAVMPFAYRYSASGFYRHTFKESRSVRLTLSYELSDSLAMYPIVRNDSTLRQEGYVLTQSMVANPSSVIANAPVEMTMDSLIFINPNQGDGLNGGILPYHPDPGDENPDPGIGYGGEIQPADYYPYLIVTTTDLKHSVRRIAALKRQKGYNIKIVTMDEVLSSPYSQDGDRIKQGDGTYLTTFTDPAGKLRQYLRYNYMCHGTKYVFLVGDSIPFRIKQYYMKDVPTDQYYSDLNADWSADTIEKYPELYVGRLLADNPEQIENYSDKLFRYELNPGQGDHSYLMSALYTESHDMHRPIYNEVQKLKIHSDSIFTNSCVMLEDTTSGARFPTGVDIVNEINAHGYGYLSFHNHAYPTGFLTFGHRKDTECPDDGSFNFLWAIDTVRIIYNGKSYKKDLPSGNGLNCLANKDFPNVCYSIACTTMPYDVVTNYESVRMNLGKSFTVGKDYGGIAFLGNTREGYMGSSSRLEERFISQLIKGNNKLGPAEAFSKVFFDNDIARYSVNYSTYYAEKYFSCVHNLLGDPEVEIWTDMPQLYSGITLTRTNNSITISGIEPDSTIIVCVQNNGTYKRKMATSDSVAFNNVSPNGIVMLYKHNRIPYISPLQLQNESLNKSQYVIVTDAIAGKSIDTSRTTGDVVVKNGIEYEIEASGRVTLEDGFKVEKGATFAVYPSSF